MSRSRVSSADDRLHLVDELADELLELLADADPLAAVLALRRAAAALDENRRRRLVPRALRSRRASEPVELEPGAGRAHRCWLGRAEP